MSYAKPIPPKDELAAFVQASESLVRIAGRYNVSATTVSNWMRGYELSSINPHPHSNREIICVDEIRRMLDERYSIREIAATLGCSYTAVRWHMKKHNLASVTKSRSGECDTCGKDHLGRRPSCDGCLMKKRRRANKKRAIEVLGGECCRCGWAGHISGFDFHHVGQKDGQLGKMFASKSWEIIERELAKCELLCALCHRLEHFPD